MTGRPSEPLYFDHGASTPVDPRVLDQFVEVERRCPANPASLHAAGRAARGALEAARDELASALGLTGEAVVFLSGGTEANNLAVLGAGDRVLPALLAPVEHASVVRAAEARGVVRWAVAADGRACVSVPDRAVGVVCLVHAQGETGVVQPVRAARAVADRAGAPLHVDASQSVGRLPLEDALCGDTVTLSAHKVGGLRGGAALLVPGRRPAPLIVGGKQEHGLRGGTVSPALAAATALAVQLAVAEQAERAASLWRARSAFEQTLLALAPSARPMTPPPPVGLAAVSMVRFDVPDGRLLLPALDVEHVCASQGSACVSGSPEPPPVLSAMGLDDADARRCVRFVFSHRTTAAQAEDGARRVARAVARLGRASRSGDVASE